MQLAPGHLPALYGGTAADNPYAAPSPAHVAAAAAAANPAAAALAGLRPGEAALAASGLAIPPHALPQALPSTATPPPGGLQPPLPGTMVPGMAPVSGLGVAASPAFGLSGGTMGSWATASLPARAFLRLGMWQWAMDDVSGGHLLGSGPCRAHA